MPLSIDSSQSLSSRSPCIVYSHLDQGAAFQDWLRAESKVFGTDISVARTLQQLQRPHHDNQAVFMPAESSCKDGATHILSGNEDVNPHSHDSTRQLAETAVGVQEMSKQLGAGAERLFEPVRPTVPYVHSTHLQAMDLQSGVSTLASNFPPPLDLTPYIFKADDQYVAGGGFGDIYRCWYHIAGSRKEVAVKAFRFTFAMNGDAGDRSVKMLRRELGIWRRLDHINVVPFLGIAYGFGMCDAMSLVSLWMPNESLHRFLARHDHGLGVGHRLQFLLDIANGLHYLHSFPIVHGDLNCNNVLLGVDYTARLADFGYASLVGNIPEALAYLQRSTTRAGALRWIAPEQVDPEEMFIRTPKSDIYSFGCVALQGCQFDTNARSVLMFLQVLSGKQPWSEVREDSAVVLRLAKGHKPGRPESRAMDDSHWNMIQHCWSPIQERPIAEAIVRSIRQLLSHCPPSVPLSDLFTSPYSSADAPNGEQNVTIQVQNEHTTAEFAAGAAKARKIISQTDTNLEVAAAAAPRRFAGPTHPPPHLPDHYHSIITSEIFHSSISDSSDDSLIQQV